MRQEHVERKTNFRVTGRDADQVAPDFSNAVDEHAFNASNRCTRCLETIQSVYGNTESEDKEEEVDEDRGNASARGGFDITMSYLVFPEVFLRCE